MAASNAQTDVAFAGNFRKIVEKIFNSWQNLRLAVEHGMGGRNGQEMAIQIMNYMYEYCIGNENITPGELQTVLEELMDQEFNTLCDDCSIPEICRNLLRYKQLCLQGELAQIEMELSKLPQIKNWLNPEVKINYTPIDADSSDDDNIDGDSDDGMSIDDEEDDEQMTAACSRVTRSQTRKNQDSFVEPEDGWTTVRTTRRK